MKKLFFIGTALVMSVQIWTFALHAQPIEEGNWTGFMWTPGGVSELIDAEFAYQGDSLSIAFSFRYGVFYALIPVGSDRDDR